MSERFDIADNIESVLATKGVTVIKGVTFQEVKGNTVMYTQGGATHELACDAILVATGRKPNTKSLDCDKAGVALTDRGAVITDEHLRAKMLGIDTIFGTMCIAEKSIYSEALANVGRWPAFFVPGNRGVPLRQRRRKTAIRKRQ